MEKSHQIAMSLLGVEPANDPADRVATLCHLIVALLQEVEALRLVAIEEHRATYANAYEASAELAHSSGGLKTGAERLVERFEGDGSTSPRELLLLQRLGYSPSDLRRVADTLETAESLS